ARVCPAMVIVPTPRAKAAPRLVTCRLLGTHSSSCRRGASCSWNHGRCPDRQGENPVASMGPMSTEGRMRRWMSVVLVAVVMTACHPRYVPLDERGVGGSGSLDSIRARVLACIAARNYDQAREYLKLAADMSEEEQARFEQMISAAERGLVPFL